ncbi:unnamed protein product [Rotaria socialis]|nr:unnamed protein product [Rotaria socialis]CAF4346821.1 unnamed protein product [Rotaria socialis]CAF4463765.1 unnamed protein product [Rotaria socialis]
MSYVRSVTSKTSSISNVKPSLSSLPESKSRLQSKPPTVPSNTSKTEIKMQLSSIPSRKDLDDIVDNLTTVVKRSQQISTPIKCSHVSRNVRRTTSLHIANRQNLSNSFVKASNSHHETLTDSNLDISRLNASRHSLRNLERFSGIKCSLPSATPTVPNTFKGLEKHTTPTKTKQINMSISSIDNPITPTATNGKVKSPWRLRFEKFLNHQELSPLSSPNETIAFQTAKTSSLNKENRTPSFRLSTRRTSKIHSISKSSKLLFLYIHMEAMHILFF